MNDPNLERAAQRLGHRAAEQLDVERVERGVLARLRADTADPGSTWRLWRRAPRVLALAATLAILIAGGIMVRRAVERDGPSATFVTAPGLRELSVDELEEMFDSLTLEAPVHEAVAVGLADLNEAELRELLRLMEG